MKHTLLSVLGGTITIATLNGVLQAIFLFASICGVIISTYYTIKKGSKNDNTGKK